MSEKQICPGCESELEVLKTPLYGHKYSYCYPCDLVIDKPWKCACNCGRSGQGAAAECCICKSTFSPECVEFIPEYLHPHYTAKSEARFMCASCASHQQE